MPTYKEKKQRLKQLVKAEEEQRRKVIEEQGHKFVNTDAFKQAEKHYKHYQYRKTDFSKMLKLENVPMRVVKGKKVYCIESPAGAYLVKNFSDIPEQYQIGFEALNRYIYRPYRTNLDGTNGLYQKESEAQEAMQQAQTVQPETELHPTKYFFNQNIRMSNLGYQYDWPKRCYPSTKVPVPDTILNLTQRAVEIFEQISGTKIEYHGEAVIVNYYKPKDYMIGHLDDGEIDQKNPIFSYCYGLSCVFLLGYPEKERQPLAIELEAGDLMIMSGFSRICYHGVPRVIQNSYKPPSPEQLQFELKVPANSENIKFINNKEQIMNYFLGHRLNINIRQVYPSKQCKQVECSEDCQSQQLSMEVKGPKVQEI